MKFADGPIAEATVLIDAPPERVWELVSDIHLVASLSTEVSSVEWIEPGVRFHGHNRHPAAGEWTTTNHVIECTAPSVFGWAVSDPANPTATWRFELTAMDGGTRLRQWARMGPGPSNLTPMIERMPEKEERIIGHRLREWQAGIDANLAAVKELAEK